MRSRRGQKQTQDTAMHRAQRARGAEGILQLLGRGAQIRVGHSRQLGRIRLPSAKARSIRWLLTPSRSLTQPDSLMRPSSSSDSN